MVKLLGVRAVVAVVAIMVIAMRDHASSVCAFSGLNDDPTGETSGPPGRTQSFGQDVKADRQDPRVRDQSHPGTSCQGN